MKMKNFSILFLLIVGVLLTLGACNGGYEEATEEEAATGTPYGADREAAAMDGDEAGEPYGDDMDEASEQKSEAEALVNEAADVVAQMTDYAELQKLMQEAKGVFIVPDYGKGAIGVGGRGGEGVLVAREGGDWTAPAFYDIGAISVGAQLGGTVGEVALLLMTDDAVENFKSENNFSLNADADLTLVDYSARAQASAGRGEDVIFWSDTEGAFAGVSLSVTDIAWDDEENRAYYGQSATAEQILTGKITGPEAHQLKSELPA